MKSLSVGMFSLLFALATCNAPVSAQTLVTYNGTGTNGANGDALSYSAVFTILNPGLSTSKLQITLINTGAVANRADLLSGVFFNLTGVSTTPTNNSASGVTTALLGTAGNPPVDPGQSSIVINSDNSTASSQTVAGSYAFGDFRGVSGSQFNYGVNASGFSTTGTGPAYSFSGQTLGGGGDDYLVRPNTTGKINGGVIPLIKNEVLLTLNGFGSGLSSTTQLSNVYFAVASGAQVVNGTTQYVTVKGVATPEPGSIGLFGGLAVSGGLLLRRRRRARR